MSETYPPEDVDRARDMITCPYRMGIGICASGCWSEPACQTDEPLEGWQHILDNPDPPSEET